MLTTVHPFEQEAFLTKCQVDTPHDIVAFTWEQICSIRDHFPRVVDLGAGDGRFSGIAGKYRYYEGYEIDLQRSSFFQEKPNAKIISKCAFTAKNGKYDLCIGNPPYVRHHDIEPGWRDNVSLQLRKEAGIDVIDARSNVFGYFILKALLTTKSDGVVAQIIPFEWVTRPSFKWLRDYIENKNWSVNVYKFERTVFDRVLTTACLTVINKSNNYSGIRLYRLSNDNKVSRMKSPTGTSRGVIEYTHRTKSNFAVRGLSPGGQNIFCLTEGERLHHGLSIGTDVRPCVTSLRALPGDITCLSQANFKKYFILQEKKCWLITPTRKMSKALKGYLENIPFERRDNYTCNNREVWWRYPEPTVGDLLCSSGFVNYAPKVITNPVKAVAVGSVYGICNVNGIAKTELVHKLRSTDFEAMVVNHSGSLKKVEVNQLNSILQSFAKE